MRKISNNKKKNDTFLVKKTRSEARIIEEMKKKEEAWEQRNQRERERFLFLMTRY